MERKPNADNLKMMIDLILHKIIIKRVVPILQFVLAKWCLKSCEVF